MDGTLQLAPHPPQVLVGAQSTRRAPPPSKRTLQHSCHENNNCRNQGACGYAGDEVEQMNPGNQSCYQHGSCGSPINVSRVSSMGPNKGKSVWKLARQIFETRMYDAGVPFGPSPGDGYPDDLVPDYLDD